MTRESQLLQAISNLRFLGYVSVHDSFPEYISLNRNMRLEVLEIVDPCSCRAAGSTIWAPKNNAASTNNIVKYRKIDDEESNSSKSITLNKTTASIVLIGSLLVMAMSLFSSSITSKFDQSNQMSPSSLSSIAQTKF